jgi:leucyl aminopeptidase
LKVVTQAMDFTRDTHELGVLFCTEGDWASSSLGKTLNEKLGDVFRSLSESGEFRALAGETALLHTAGTLPTRRLLLTGLGPDETVDAEALRRATAAAARRARGTRVPTIAFMLPESPRTLAVETAAQAVVEGAMIALHSFNEYYTEATAETPVTEIRVGAPGSRMTAEVGEGARRGEAYASASNWARDLSIHPANVLTPRRLAQEARALASLGGVTVEVKDETWIAEMRMGGLLAVTRGSEEPPRFIIVDYHPDGHTGAPVVLVGKGVTFDSGGLSLKDPERK